MVAHAPLRKVIGTDALAPVTAADLAFSFAADCIAPFRLHVLIQAAAQNLQRLILIFMLAFFVLTRNDNPRRNMRHTDGRVGCVYALTARSACAEHINSEVVRINFKFNLLNLGQNGNGCRACVDSAARFRFGHALNAVNAAFVF